MSDSTIPPIDEIEIEEPVFAILDPNQIAADMHATYSAFLEDAGVPRDVGMADPARLLLYPNAALLAQAHILLNDAAKMVLLRYARGNYLDCVAELVGTYRLQAGHALTTVELTLSQPLPTAVTIPQGWRMSVGTLEFESPAALDIPAGDTVALIPMQCKTGGMIGNGYAPGQIKNIVDWYPWMDHAANVTLSQGGSDAESDDRLRERAHRAPEGFSTAGPRGAYAYWALTAHPSISSVAVDSPEPGVARITALMEGGLPPTQEVNDAIFATCNDDTRRPFTDRLIIGTPEPMPYDISLTYWIPRRDATLAAETQRKVDATITAYTEWQRAELGRDINPDTLIAALKRVGVKRCEITSPTFKALGDIQFAQVQDISVVYGGLEDA